MNYLPLTISGAFAFTGKPVPLDAGRAVNSLYVETVAPIVRGVSLQLAARDEDYGKGLNALSPKIGLIWRPGHELAVRATFGRSFKAPGLLPTYGTWNGPTNLITTPGVAAPVPLTMTLPNPALKPERSKSYTLGADWSPMSSLNFTLDWWRYDFTDIIGQESPNLIVQDYLTKGLYADRLVFDAANELRLIILKFSNFPSLSTDGLDFGLTWRPPGERFGQFTWSLRGTWTHSYSYRLRDDQPVKNGVGRTNDVSFASPVPEFKINLALDWTRKAQFARATLRYISGMYSDAIPDNDPRQIDHDYFQLDLVYGYTFDRKSGPLKIQAGIQNVNDARPPLLTGLQPSISGVYDPRGRVFSLDITKQF